MGPEKYELTLTRHHICSDQWSSPFSTRALKPCTAILAGQRALPPALRLQFTITRGGRATPQGASRPLPRLAEAVEALQGIPDESALVATHDRQRPASGPGGRVTGAIPAPVVRGLRALALSHEATLFMALDGIFNAAVYRLTNQSDLVVVTPTAGRVHPERNR